MSRVVASDYWMSRGGLMFSSASARAAAGAYIGNWLRSFEEFPPGQKSGSFNLERVMEAVSAG